VTPGEKKPIFPSDLAGPSSTGPGDTSPAFGSAGGELLLAGRVVQVTETTLAMADAFATVHLAGSSDAAVGDLVVLAVHRGPEGLALVRLVERHRPTAPHGREQARFAQGGVGRNLLARARAFAGVRSFFTTRGFLEVDTPLLVPSPGLDLHLDALEASGGYLVTSPEYQMKRLLSAGVPRLFQISHAFRKGETGARHNPEFAILEWYRAFSGIEDVIGDTERLVADIAISLGENQKLRGEHGPINVALPFARMTVARAFAQFAGISEDEFFHLARHDADSFFRILVEQVEPGLASARGPVFLVDYPIEQASLARPKPSDPRVSERFELYAGGVELCNGFGELTCPEEQRRRLMSDQRARQARGKPVYPIDERFLAALAEGMPPSAGNALGLDRLVALCLGEPEIARVMPFPAGEV
jgi:elongation factor P--(R)-beta-lysine ligase